MKIAFDAKRLFNNLTGLGNYSRTLVQDLQNLAPQNQYVLYSPRARHNPDTEYFFDTTRFTIVTAPNGLLGKLWRPWTISRNIRRDHIDLYHGLSHDLPFSVKAKHQGTRYIVTIHDVCYKTFPEMFPRTEQLIYQRKYSHSLRVADHIVAISESTKRDILNHYPWVSAAKVDVIYQALNPVYYTPCAPAAARQVVKRYGIEGDYMLYVGTINSRKNLLGIVQAYALLPPHKRLPLVVIGNGHQYKDQVIRYAEENDLLQHLNFIDNVTLPDNLQAFYTAAMALLYPSFYEGFGLPVAEALLSGIPVVTSDISSLPEAAGPGALYVDPTSVESIADAIEQLIDSPTLRQELADKGHTYVLDKLEPKKLTAQMLELYQKIVSQ